jgi:Zn-dependent protease
MDTITTIFYIVILICSVIIHEVAHGYAADSLGDPTPRQQGRLTLNPLAHIDWFGSVLLPAFLVLTGAGFVLGWAKPVPFNVYNLRNRKWGPALVALAGPASNIALAIVFGLLIRFVPGIDVASPFYMIASGVVFINVLLAIFNLIPIPPLDGHHVLFAFLPARFARLKQFLLRWSLFLLLFVIFFLWDYVMPIIFFVYDLIVGTPLFL